MHAVRYSTLGGVDVSRDASHDLNALLPVPKDFGGRGKWKMHVKKVTTLSKLPGEPTRSPIGQVQHLFM